MSSARIGKNATIRTALAIVTTLVMLLALAGCGNGDDTGSTAEPTGMDMSDDHGDGEFAFGEPADASEADRTIEIEAKDDLSFDPPSVQVEAGEVVTFAVNNTGQILHSFLIGDEHAQEEHEEEMQEMSEGVMHEEVNVIDIPAGETVELTWRFTEAGEVMYGCHQPGHYAGGMVGTVTVSG